MKIIQLLFFFMIVFVAMVAANERQQMLRARDGATRSRWWFWSSKPKTMTPLHYHLEAVEDTIKTLEEKLFHTTPKKKDDLAPAKTVVDRLKDKFGKMENHLSTKTDDKGKDSVKRLHLEADKMRHAIETVDSTVGSIIDGTRHLNLVGSTKRSIDEMKEDAKHFEEILDDM